MGAGCIIGFTAMRQHGWTCEKDARGMLIIPNKCRERAAGMIACPKLAGIKPGPHCYPTITPNPNPAKNTSAKKPSTNRPMTFSALSDIIANLHAITPHLKRPLDKERN